MPVELLAHLGQHSIPNERKADGIPIGSYRSQTRDADDCQGCKTNQGQRIDIDGRDRGGSVMTVMAGEDAVEDEFERPGFQ